MNEEASSYTPEKENESQLNKERTEQKLRQYLGQDDFVLLKKLAERVDPKQSYNETEVQELHNFVTELLKKFTNDEKLNAEPKVQLRSYFNDLGLYNIPRF